MGDKKITFQFAEMGHWLARCNHNTNLVELNAREYASLSPMMQDYIWVHECVHLLADVHDETDCNSLSDEIFISRAKSKRELAERRDFVAAANDQSFTRIAKPASDNTPMLLAALIVAVILLITKK